MTMKDSSIRVAKATNSAPDSNLENVLYAAWKEAEPWEKAAIESRLFNVLRSHASKVCWMVLRDRRPDFVDEIAEDAIMDLPRFEGLSQFSTWFHSRAFNRLNDERRKRLTRKEAPLEGDPTKGAESSVLPIVVPDTDQKILVQQLLAMLTDRDAEIVRLRFFEGMSTQEIAVLLGVDKNYVHNAWLKRIKPFLRECHGARK
jgi:RNA polymerase sigma factor (sigma-70 family)